MAAVRLPSGADLDIPLAPFADSKALYQALLEEVKGLRLDMSAEVDGNFYKDLFCVGFSSKKIEAAAFECMKRCTYNGERLTDKTFEKEEARQDYFAAMYEVTRVNVTPFTKDLYAQFKQLSSIVQNVQA